MISQTHKFVFVHIQKTGGNSTRLAIAPYCIDEILVTEKQKIYNDAHGGLPHRLGVKNSPLNLAKHARLQAIHDLWDETALGPWASYLKFACVRNPWERMISFYFSPHFGRAVFDEAEFIEFVTSAVDRAQIEFVTIDGKPALDRVLRFENLASDFAAFCAEVGIEADLPHVNQSKRGPYQEYYTPKTRAIVQDLYRRDIEQFEYTFDG